MATRIRELRRRRGWTLQDVARRTGTTAQTIQRLETGKMSVSTDWLDRLANAFGTHPADLLGVPGRTAAHLIGTLDPHGLVRRTTADAETVSMDIPAENAVAVRLAAPVGGHRRDTLLIANKLPPGDIANAHNRDALVALSISGKEVVLLRRVILAADGAITLVPCTSASGDVRYGIAPCWIAPLVMRIEYL